MSFTLDEESCKTILMSYEYTKILFRIFLHDPHNFASGEIAAKISIVTNTHPATIEGRHLELKIVDDCIRFEFMQIFRCNFGRFDNDEIVVALLKKIV